MDQGSKPERKTWMRGKKPGMTKKEATGDGNAKAA
jgi:hypothetical protein